jgi:hypothetical protein
VNRLLYRCLLWLHPPSFRREFSAEMLWIFDESVAGSGARILLSDALRSLTRQWVLRSGSWKIVLAVSLAMFQLTLGSVGTLFFGRRQVKHFVPAPPALANSPFGDVSLSHASLAHAPITVEFLVYLALFVVAGLIMMVLLLVSSLNRIPRRSRVCSNYAR